MKPLLTTTLIFISAQYATAFDIPKMPSVPAVEAPAALKANPEVEAKVNNYLKKNDEANQFMNKSVASLFNIIAPADKKDKATQALKKAEGLQDAKQKADLMKKIDAFRAQIVNKTLGDEKVMKEMNNLSAQDKVSLGKVLYNLHLATLLYKDLANEGPDVLKAASSDPMMLKRADEIKAAINESKVQMGNAQNLVTGVSKIAGLNGVKVDLPKSSSDAPQ